MAENYNNRFFRMVFVVEQMVVIFLQHNNRIRITALQNEYNSLKMRFKIEEELLT